VRYALGAEQGTDAVYFWTSVLGTCEAPRWRGWGLGHSIWGRVVRNQVTPTEGGESAWMSVTSRGAGPCNRKARAN
jgi:hypothetical protein